MRISDWSSDVCSSDLFTACSSSDPALTSSEDPPLRAVHQMTRMTPRRGSDGYQGAWPGRDQGRRQGHSEGDRKSVVEGKSVSVRVDLGGRRILQKKTQ